MEMKLKLLVYGLLGVCFYLIFDWSTTNLEVLEQTLINMDDNLALRGFYVFISLLSFIVFMYFFVKFEWLLLMRIFKKSSSKHHEI